MLGDGRCDAECDTSECSWDGHDCECAAGCRYQELATCKLECMVPACGFGYIPGYSSCNEYSRSLALYNSIRSLYNSNYIVTEPIDSDNCYWCPSEESFTTCVSGGVCSPLVCIRNYGTCRTSTKCTSTSLCVTCQEGQVNDHGKCRTTCSPGLGLYPLVANICFPVEDDSTPEHPDVFYVNDGGQYADFGQRLSFSSLPEALLNVKKQHSRVLLSDEHFVTVQQASRFLVSVAHPKPLALTFTDRTFNLTLAPACSTCRATVHLDPADPVKFVMGQYSFGMYYCSIPFVAILTIERVDFIMDGEAAKSQSALVQNYVGKAVLKQVSFRGIQGYNSIISASNTAKFEMVSVDFVDITVSNNVVEKLYRGCGDENHPVEVLSYTNGTMSAIQAKNAFEFQYTASVTVAGLDVQYLQAKYFLSTLGVDEVVFSDCRLLYSQFRNGAVFRLYPVPPYTLPYFADSVHFGDPSKADILVARNVFRGNEVQHCFYIDVGYLPKSVRIANCEFYDEWHLILSLNKSTPVQKSDIYGIGRYENGVRRNPDPIFVDLSNLRLQNCTSPLGLFSVANYTRVSVSDSAFTDNPDTQVRASALILSKCFNVSLTRVLFSNFHSDSGFPVLNISSITGGLSITSAFITHSSGEELLSISKVDTVTFRNFTVTNSTGFLLVNLANVDNSIVLSSLFENTEAREATFLCGAVHCEFAGSRFADNRVGGGGVVQLPASSTQGTSLIVKDSSFDRNRVGENAGAVLVQSALETQPTRLTLQRLTFTSNTAETAVVLTSARTVLTSDSRVEDCRFLQNSAGEGVVGLQYEAGALTISRSLFRGNLGDAVNFAHSAVSVAPQLHITNTEFIDTQGSGVYVGKSLSGSVFSARDSVFAGSLRAGLVLQQVFGEVSNCTFPRNTASAGGAVVLDQDSVTQFTNCTFTHNSAVGTGGAVLVAEGSRLVSDHCTFVGNSAGTTGGAVSISPDAAAEFSYCRFEENTAVSGSALYLLMSAASVATRCEFRFNYAADEATVAMFFSALTLRNCSVRENRCGQMTPGVVLSLSNLTIEAITFSGHQGLTGTILQATMRSIVNISASEFTGIESQSGAIYVDDTAIEISHSVFQSMSADFGSVVVSVGSSQLVFSDNAVVLQWNKRGGALHIQQSLCRVQHSRFSAFNSSAVYSKRADIALSQCSFRSNVHLDITAAEGGGLYCQDCESVDIQGCDFVGLRADSGAGVFLQNSKPTSKFSVENSTFQRNVAGESAGIRAEMTNLEVKQCVFINNEAERRGGAVTLLCTDTCLQSVRRSNFAMNRAGSHGGAICWQGSTPTFKGNLFDANTAPYGQNISSFSTSLLLLNTSRQEVASGQVFPSLLEVEVRDHYNQTVLIDNSTTAELTILSGEIYGAVKATANMGRLVFSGFSLVGQANTTIHISSAELQSTLEVDITFRKCVMGEFESKGRCIVCGPGTYSVDPAQPCTECDKHADCAGRYYLVPRPGYWRPSTHSTRLYECPNPAACLGPPALTGTCALGYTGNMCQTCAVDYVRYVKTHCQPCPSQTSIALRTAGLMGCAVLFSVILVISSIKSAYKVKSQMSLSLKTLMNYLQLVMLMGNFNLSWPALTKRLLNIQDSAGGFSEQIFAPGCLRSGYDESDDFYQKVLAMAFLPLGVLSLSSVSWALWALLRRQVSIVRSELVGSATILFFLVHPSVVRVMSSTLNCENIDGEYWVVGLHLRCWQGAHWRYALAVAVPCILLWGVGVPALILLFLSRHKNILKELQSRVRFGYLFNGYKPEKYYWEFIVIYRKLVVISLAVFLSRFSQVVPALATLAVLLLSFALQDAHKPFRLATFNTLEQRSLLVSFVTLFCGLYFLFNSLSTAVETVLFAVIVGVNAYFLQFWVRTAFTTLAAKLVNRLPCLQGRFIVLGEDRVVTLKQYKAIQDLAQGCRFPLGHLQKSLYFSRSNKQLA